MSTCQPHSELGLDCTYSALDTPTLVMTKVGNDFPFRGINAGANLDISQSATDVIISVPIPTLDGAYVGMEEAQLAAPDQSFDPIIFSNNTLPNYYNTGLYDETTGLTTIPVTGIYDIKVTITIGNTTAVISGTTEFQNRIFIYQNAAIIMECYNSNGSQQDVSNSVGYIGPLTAGDIIRIRADVGINLLGGLPYTLYGGVRSSFSINRIY